jgi:RimJ/RimL family protein N-acetyltransferase
MRQIILNQKERVAQFLIEQNAYKGQAVQYEAIGVEENGNLIAGVVYENYEKNARISLHCAGIGKRWLSRQFLWMVFDYPFNQLNVNVIVNTVSSDNKDSIKFTEHCGFKEQTRIIGGASDGDLIIYTLYKKDCKWIGLKHEK